MANTAFQNDTLSQIRIDFIKATKRHSLLSDGLISTNVDNGANRYINQGQRFLDLRVDHPTLRKTRFKKMMAVGDFSAEVNGLISIDTVAITDSSSRWDLTNNVMDAQILKSQVGKPLSLYETGRPTLWAINDIYFGPEQYTRPRTITATSATVATGTEALTFTATQAQDGTVHQITDTSGEIDIYYEFALAGIQTPTTVDVIWIGRLNGNNDTIVMQARNWVDSDWDDLGTITGIDEQNNRSTRFTLAAANIGTGGDASKVRIRFFKTTTLTISKLITDHIYVASSLLDYEDIHSSPDAYNYSGIIFDKKMDAAYELEIVGRFFSKILDMNTDKSYWTVRHPDLLVLAAAYCYEREQRNQSGMRSWLEAMEPLLFEIDSAGVELEMSGEIMRLEA